MRPPLGSPPATGKSFRFVRACDARFLDVKKERRSKKEAMPRSLFPFWTGRLSLFPFGPGAGPFSLVKPSETKGDQVKPSETK